MRNFIGAVKSDQNLEKVEKVSDFLFKSQCGSKKYRMSDCLLVFSHFGMRVKCML